MYGLGSKPKDQVCELMFRSLAHYLSLKWAANIPVVFEVGGQYSCGV